MGSGSISLSFGAVARGAGPWSRCESIDATAFTVQDLYRQLLHRPADASGLSIYTNALQQGVTNEQLLAILAGSDEYFSRP